jgi:hypothetical protein
MVYKPKMLIYVFVVVIYATNFCNAAVVDNEISDENSGRALSLAAANHPAGNSMF